MTSYIKKHPWISGIAATGGLLSLAPVAAPAAIGAYGFGALGPLAGSAAAAWQTALGGPIAAGSWFAWYQSVAMGGAAAGAFTTAGYTGAGIVTAAVVAGALDDVTTSPVELKEAFLGCWRKEMGQEQEKEKKEGHKEL